MTILGVDRTTFTLPLFVALVATLVPAARSEAAETAPVETAIRDVQNAAASSTGTTGLFGYTAAQDIVGPVSPGERLGGARINRVDHPGAFEGMWGQEGEFGGWLAPPTDDPNRHYRPRTTLVENAYFDNELTSDALPATPGDHVEFGMGIMPMDTPLPWERERVAARGTLGWDGTVLTQGATSRFSDLSGEIDVVMFRADILARDGDVDARSRSIELEPLVLDLPRVYDGIPNYIGVTALSTPYLNYITEFSVVALPTAGKLVVHATVSGYIPEAKTYELPNGAVMKEWHLPLGGVIAIDRGNSDLSPVATSSLPQGGLGLITDAMGSRRVEVPPGASVVAQPGASQQNDEEVVDDGDDSPTDHDEPESATEMDVGLDLDVAAGELALAARVDHGLAEPIDIDLSSSGFRTRLTPDYRGEGVVALEDTLTTRHDHSYADALTVPAVSLGSAVIALDRSRLIDLRVLPFRNGGGIGVTPTARFDEFNQSITRFIRIYRPGLLVHAVYDLGDGIHAFVEHQLFHGGVPPGGRVNTNVIIESLDARPVEAYPHQYVELTDPGPASLSGNEFTTEFSARTSPFGMLGVGDHRINSDYRTSNRIFGGVVTVLRSPAPLMGRAPDPAASISGEQVALVQSPPPDMPASPSTLSTFRVGLDAPPPRMPPAPPPLGHPCGEIVVVDSPVPDAPPHADVRAAWFDADATNVYASIRLADIPTEPVSPTGDRVALTWRADHQGYSARATLAPTGQWSFELGRFIFGSFFRIGTLTGEVQPGSEGVIRMAIPRDWLELEDGVLLRDTVAHAFAATTTTRIDSAPDGSSYAYGLGDDHVITTCPGSIPPILDTIVEFTSETTTSTVYGDRATFAARLVDENGSALTDAEVSFALASMDGTREWVGMTDGSGVARVTTDITERAGTYELVARYGGADDAYRSSEATVPIEVQHAPSSLELVVEGRGSNRFLTAHLSRGGTAQPIAGRTVDFYAGSEFIGSAITDQDGVATLQAPPRFRGAAHDFQAHFDGDDFYLGSSDKTQPDATGEPA